MPSRAPALVCGRFGGGGVAVIGGGDRHLKPAHLPCLPWRHGSTTSGLYFLESVFVHSYRTKNPNKSKLQNARIRNGCL
jgi:hypothetical protein